MARLIKANGEETQVHPENGKRWELLELQEHVEGYIELMPGLKRGVVVVLNEEGRLRNLPRNPKATEFVNSNLRGGPLRYRPEIFGNVLIFEEGEKM